MVKEKYILADHPILQLVPPTFATLAEGIYKNMGVPLVTAVNVWDVFAEFVEQVEVAVEAGIVSPEVF